MKIVYLGPISVAMLASSLEFSCDVPVSRLKYAHGARLVLALLRRGHEVAVITPCEQIMEVRKFRAGNCTLYLIPQRRTRYQMLTFFSKEVRLMVSAINDFDPDVVFPQWLYQYSRAAIVSGKPCLAVGRDSPWRVAKLMRNFRMWHRTLYSCFFVSRHIQNLTTISPYMVDGLMRWWKRKGKGCISVLPNAIPLNDVAKANIIRTDAKTIVCVSDWNELKNVKCLIRAFINLRNRHADWRLIVYGTSMQDDGACGVWMKSKGFSTEGIDLRGYGKQEEIRKVLLEEADVFCSPTLEESFGQVFLEAMAQGVPCIGGERSGAVPWVIGGGGVVCDVTDSTKLAECIECVMMDAGWRKRLSEEGKRRVEEMFDIEKVVDMYELELRKIAKC